ncbi:MAG: hypothetical protein JXM69_05270 [Anaerolineae bacterium]|nr:hypothetical protein [Anaerolineae bacterium]
MKVSNTVIWLSWLIAVLALLAAGTGLFWQAGGSPFSFTTLRGETVQMYGQGLYCYDTLFTGAGFRGTDALTLLAGVPMLLLFLLLYRRGSLRGGLLLTGALVYFLYVYASLALAAAYNTMFLVYIALFSASFFAVVRVFTVFDLQALAASFSGDMPRRGPAIFMFASGLVTLVVWLGPLLSALIQNKPPNLLGSYTTKVTDVLDLGLITPTTFLAGVLILRRAAPGYLIACSLLVLEVMLAPMIVAQSISQTLVGVSFTTGEIIGPIAGFAVLGLFALWILVAILRNVSNAPLSQVTLT